MHVYCLKEIFLKNTIKINSKYSESSYAFIEGEENPGLWKHLGQNSLEYMLKMHIYGPHPSSWSLQINGVYGLKLQ